jgi:C_GCAxxG_C_C family probable redox protein
MMNTISRIEKISVQAKNYFENGYHCAESIAASVLEGLGEDASWAIAHATAFGGGFGRTFEGPCGALSGSLIVIGHLHARKGRGESWDDAAQLGAIIQSRFMDQYETIHCRTLRERFGPEDQEKECADIVERMTADLVELLHSNIV